MSSVQSGQDTVSDGVASNGVRISQTIGRAKNSDTMTSTTVNRTRETKWVTARSRTTVLMVVIMRSPFFLVLLPRETRVYISAITRLMRSMMSEIAAPSPSCPPGMAVW